MTEERRILIIKLGALGDFVQALGPMQAIRRHHGPTAHITLLTTKPYMELAQASGWFDRVRVDDRPKWWQVGKIRRLRQFLNGGRFDWVYDLQTSDRSNFYYRLLAFPYPFWSGIALGCSHPDSNPERKSIHTMERQREQLRLAGIVDMPPLDLAWLTADTNRFALPARFALLVPGGSPHRPGKRWPAESYARLSEKLRANGVVPVLLGTKSERQEVETIMAACSEAINLCGKTTLMEVAGLARQAICAIGNDTGPMHLIAAVGCPSLVLYSHASAPARCGQRGEAVCILRRADLKDLSVEEVWEKVGKMVP